MKPSVIKKLAKFVNNPETQTALNELLEKDSSAMKDFNAKKFGLVSLFKHYSISIKFDQLIEVSTRMPARHYTVASGSRANPAGLKLCVALTIDDLNGPTFSGRVSKNLSDSKAKLDANQGSVTMRLMPQKSTFYMPTLPNTHCLCIASGAGIAPFMSMLEDRAFDLKNGGSSNIGEMTMFFGYRNPNQDFLYRDQLKAYQDSGVLANLFNAVSRGDSPKAYVQDLLESNSDIVKSHLGNNGRIYVCGNGAMARAVTEVIEKCIAQNSNCSLGSAGEIVAEMKKNGRLCIEAWG